MNEVRLWRYQMFPKDSGYFLKETEMTEVEEHGDTINFDDGEMLGCVNKDLLNEILSDSMSTMYSTYQCKNEYIDKLMQSVIDRLYELQSDIAENIEKMNHLNEVKEMLA